MDIVQELYIKQAIREKLYTYCRSMDRHDIELGKEVFAEDSEVDYGSIYKGTGWGFVKWVEGVHKKSYIVTSHQMPNMLIKVAADGQTAVSETYLFTVQLTRPNRAGKQQEVHTAARYLDEWVCLDGDWKIKHRRYLQDISEARNCDYILDTFGYANNRTDPSYALFDNV